MAQVSMYNSTAAVWTGNNLILAPREPNLNPNNHYSPSVHLTEKTISSKTTEFINKLSQTFFKETKAPEVKSLNELLQFVSKNGVDPIRDKLTKQTGFLSRIFSNESWKDWLEDKTPIGKVVSLYCECVTYSTHLEALMGRLDKKVLEVANKDAALLLQSLEQPGSTQENETEEKTTSRSFWSTFLSLPVAEGHVFNAHNFHARNFPANFDVSTLNGANGFVLNGINIVDQTGTSVSGAGDINGDGIADLVVGAYGASGDTGNTYVIFGSNAGWTSPIDLSSLNGVNGFVLNGVNANDASGESVRGAGDINGDGIADLVVGAGPSSNKAGSTYVIFGSKAGWSSPISLSSLNGSNGFVLNGVSADDFSGFSVSGAGDINGDGIADLIVGAYGASSNAGNSYVIFGSKEGWNSPISLSSLNGSNGFVLNGVNANDNSGNSVSGAGDINGDGIADLVVGAYGASGYTGSTYVIFGSTAPWNSPISLATLNGTNGFVLNGENANDESGTSVSKAGDINGDGIADLVIGAPYASTAAGKTYVVFGSKAGWSSPISLSSLNGSNGFVLNGVNANDFSGDSVSGAGDINGDGISDLIVGAPQIGDDVGIAYVIFGSVGPWGSPLSLSSLNGVNGFSITNSGVTSNLGISVRGAGDINDDGIADIIIGAPSVSTFTGQTYVIFGQQTGSTTTHTTTTTPTTTTATPTTTTTQTTTAPTSTSTSTATTSKTSTTPTPTTTTQTTTIPTTTTSTTPTPTTTTQTTTIPTTSTSTTPTPTTTTQTTTAPTTSTSTTPPPTTTTQTTTIPPTTASTTTTTLTPTTTTSTTTTSTTTASTAASTSTTKPTTTTTQRTITTLKTTAPSVGSQMLPDWKITALTVLAVAIAII